MSEQGAAPPPATIDNFDANMAAQTAQATAPDAAPDSGGEGSQRALGSMFSEFATPVDAATGRETDGAPFDPELNAAASEEGETQQAADDALDDALGEEGEPEADAAPDPDAELLGQIKLDDLLPEDAMQRLKVKQKINGEEREVTVAEAVEQGMLLRDYSRKSRELATERQEHSRAVDAFVGLTDRWKADSPDSRVQTRRDLERLGVPIEAIAEDIAKEYVMLQDMDPVARENYEARRKAEREAAEARAELERVRRADQDRDSQQRNAGLRERVVGWRDAEFKALGLKGSPTTHKLFADHLGALWDRSTELTADTVRMAAKAAAADFAELVERHSASQQTQQKAARPIAAKPAPRGGGTKPKGGRAGFKATIDSFDDFVGRR